MKPLLLTMTQERKEHISLMVKNIYPTFQGIVAVLNQPSNDGTEKVLEENKGDGLIIKRPWVFNHGYLMNELFLSRKIRPNQWCLYLDSPESCKDEFIEIIPWLIKNYESNNIGALCWDNRPYLFKYNEYMEVYGAYHWGISNLQGQITSINDKDRYIINRRKETPEISWCLNPIKSFICYPLSNETTIMYGKFGNDTVRFHEHKRREFRSYLQQKLNLNLDTLDDLIGYLKKINNKEIIPDDYFIDYVDFEYRLSELFQLKVLNYNFMGQRPDDPEGMHDRYKWSFRDFLDYGDGWHNKEYKGRILNYEKTN